MSNTSPESKAAVQADLQAAFDPEHTNQDTSFDPALQELMANDQLKIYGDAYKHEHPEADLTDPAQLKQAAGVLMLAMHLGHYPTADEITTDSQNATGIISTTNAEITRRNPTQTTSGSFAPLSQFESRLGNDMMNLHTGMQGRAGKFAYEDTIATDSLLQSRILAAANAGRGDQMWRLIQNGASGPVEGCAASVSAILNGAGVANVNEMTVGGLEQELLRQGWTIDTVARPGDVVVGYGGKSSGHTGIVGTDGTVYDNKSYDDNLNVSGQWQQESLDYFQSWNTVRFLRPPAHFDTYNFPYGQCTYWAAKNHATYFANGADYGNACQWIDSAHKFGIKTTNVPSVGAIVVYRAGNGYDPDYGHVAIVTAVSGNTYTISEMNYDGSGDGKVTTRTIDWPDTHVEGFIP
ncbi:MAG: CHAP domain-containing protein [Candidatus Melainabacteria bacterium]|nr:CHAP domain-containing protein [Candidatus Melainabacteria bacterium]